VSIVASILTKSVCGGAIILSPYPQHTVIAGIDTFFLLKVETSLDDVRFSGGEYGLKEWRCIQIDDHRKVAECIEDVQRDGWNLHTYQASGRDIWVKHYLLFERER